jgi:hypothetical protein
MKDCRERKGHASLGVIDAWGRRDSIIVAVVAAWTE